MNSLNSETIRARGIKFCDDTRVYFSVLMYVLEFDHAVEQSSITCLMSLHEDKPVSEIAADLCKV